MDDIRVADHAAAVALADLGLDRTRYAACSWMMIKGGCVVGCAQFRVKTRGPNKGGRSWSGPTKKAIITADRILNEARECEARGQCALCMGEQTIVVAWSAENGKTLGPCSRCGGTGKPPGGPLSTTSVVIGGEVFAAKDGRSA